MHTRLLAPRNDGIKKAIAGRLITASITAAGFDGEGLVTSVEYAWDTVKVVYQWQSGRYEEASYDFATFFTRVVVPSSLSDEVLTSASLMLTASGTVLEISPGQIAFGQSFL